MTWAADVGQPVRREEPVTPREYLAKLLYTRDEVDAWFEERAFPFTKHDPELGWLLRNARFSDGVDRSVSTYTYGSYDERVMIHHANRPCRVNTYGNSMTQCHQVSDGETWQEVLAAHFGEPIRNFGVGGWSVYQAYLRVLREESRVPAQYLILNIFDDDHYRNLDAWRNIRVPKHPQHIESTLPHLRVERSNGVVSEKPNPCPTRDSYYRLCELDWVEEQFGDDFVLGIMVAHANAASANPARAYDALMDLAQTHGIDTRIDRGESLDAAAEAVFTEAALYSTRWVVDRVEEFARQRDKKVLYVLSYQSAKIAQYIQQGTRFDQAFVDYLVQRNLPLVDLMQGHRADYSHWSGTVEEYLQRYFIGHYNPLGNFFTAFTIKDKLRDLLEPPPPAYRPLDDR